MKEKKYCIQGDEYSAKGLYEMAIAQYTRAIEINPKCCEAYTGRGLVYCLFIKDLYEEALSDFTKSIDLNPSNTLALHGRGMIYFMKGLYDLALRDFTRVLEVNPRWGTGLYVSRGEIYLHFGRFPEATGDFTTALELNSENGMAFRGRALAWFHQGDYEKALQDVLRAQELGIEIDCIEIDPDFLRSLQLSGREGREPDTGQERASVIPFPLPSARKSAGGV